MMVHLEFNIGLQLAITMVEIALAHIIKLKNGKVVSMTYIKVYVM